MKNFTNNFKQFTSRLSARWLIMALMLLVGTSSAWAGTNWQGKIYFKAPDSWNLSTNSKVQIVLTQSSNASSGTKYAYVVGTMEKVTNSDRLYFYSSINTNHGSWGTEYIAFIANSTAWNTGDFYINSCAHYTAPSSYRATNSSNYYLYKASTEDVDKQSTIANNVSLSGSYNSSRRTILNEAQTINLKTDGSNSGLGGKVKITGYYDTADKTLQSSTDETDGTANDKSIGYADAAIGSKITLVATPSTSYKFDGWYDDKGAIVSSNTSYSYIVHSESILEARFSQSCTTPTAYQVSGMVPETAYADYDGSIVIKLANSQTGVSYNLFKDGVKVSNTTKTGTNGNSLTWEGIIDAGEYTVKAIGCNSEDVPMSGTYNYECISDIKLEFTLQDDATYCLGEEEKVKITYKGTELETKYGYVWRGAKYTYTSIVPANEAELPIYFNAQNDGTGDGSIYLDIKSCGSTVQSNRLEFTVNQTPTITASKTSCAPYEEITLSSAAGAGTTWSTDGGMLSATSGESVTFKAAPAGTPYTVAASANGCTDTKTITVECAEEDCSGAQSTDVIITCDPNGYTGDVYCHIWPYGGEGIAKWPGTKGTKVDGIWTWTFSSLKSNTTYDLILNGGDGKGQTNDIDQDAVPGNQYDYTLVHNGWPNFKTTVTEATPKAITVATDPTVTTVSAEQKEGEAAVVIKGFLQATGCADITKYGYQYRVSGNGDYTDVQVTGSKNICEEWIVECDDLEFGETYDFRAKATNEGGGKGYGDVIQVTIQGQSTPVVIKAVRNDKTVNESHWADFVALYVQEDGITAAGAKEVKYYTWEYSTDGTNWSSNFTGYVLGGASATVGVTNGSEKCNNIRPTKTGKYRVKVTYDNTKEQYSNIITITSDGFKLKYPEYGQNAGSDFAFEAENRTIPVFVVKTTENFPDCPASGMPSQDVEGQKAKKSVDVKIFENGNVVYDRKARMNYRGSSSLNFRKKSYAFCTGKEKTKNNKGDVDTGKENLFDLSNGAKDKDWVLYAAMPDPSMMRNRLIFDTYAQMTGKWGVDSKFVELIIDDEYMGVYVLMDKITNNEKRVNITAADGFILKFDKTDVTDRFEDENSEKRNTFTTEKTGKSGIGSYGATFDQRFEIEYPEMEDMGTDKWVEFVNDNVKGKIEAFEKALEAGNYTEVRKLIDYESWADWFIISEFAKNVDAYRASCFFVYNGDKIEARPLWDQELSFDNTATTVGNGKGCSNTSGLLIQNAGVYSDDFPAPFWFIGHTDENKSSTITGGLLNDPCFVTMVKNRYKDHLNNALSNGQLTGKISDYQEELTDAAKNRETATWRPSDGEITACTGGGTGYTNIPVSTSISTMTNWISNRPAKLTTALDALTGSSVNISIEPSFVETYPWEPFTLTVYAPEGYEYEMAFTKEGADATGNMVVVKGGDIYTVKIKRPANTLEQVFETVPYLATATLKVADDGCGGMTTPEANVNIRLNDREEDCE